MLSAKSFRPPLRTPSHAHGWLRVFVADICGRMRDEGCLQLGGRRPKALSLGWRGGGKTGWGIGGKSKGCTLPIAGDLSEEVLFGLAEGLLKQVDDWPCGNLSLSVGAFEEAESGRRIMEFLMRGDTAKNLRDNEPLGKRQRRLLGKDSEEVWNENEFLMNEGEKSSRRVTTGMPQEERQEHCLDKCLSDSGGPNHEDYDMDAPAYENPPNNAAAVAPLTQHCVKCNIQVPMAEVSEHQDWHFAKDLVEEERRAAKAVAIPQPVAAALPPRSKRKASQMETVEKGQSKLTFKRCSS